MRDALESRVRARLQQLDEDGLEEEGLVERGPVDPDEPLGQAGPGEQHRGLPGGPEGLELLPFMELTLAGNLTLRLQGQEGFLQLHDDAAIEGDGELRIEGPAQIGRQARLWQPNSVGSTKSRKT